VRSPSLAALCLLAAAGCATTPAAAPDPLDARDYAPLKIGASWTYRMRFPGQSGERTITIVDNKDGYFLDDAGGQFRHAPDGLKDPVRYVIRTPLVAGTQWKSIVSASAVERYEIESVGEPCQAVAGTFSDCLIVRASLRQDAEHTLHIRFAWAKKIGLVKVSTELEANGKRIPQTDQSLIRYDLTGKKKPAKDGEEPPGDWSR